MRVTRSAARSGGRISEPTVLASSRADAPVAIWQSEALTSALQSVLVVPLTTNLDRAQLAGTAIIHATDDGPTEDSVALALQMRAIPKTALASRVRGLTEAETAKLELATDEALGREDTRA